MGFFRERIIWLKGGSELFNKGKYKISKKGILRIMEATGQDNTTFTCKGEIKNQYVKLASLSLLHWNG